MSIIDVDYIKDEDVKEVVNLVLDSFSNDPYSWSVAVGFCLKELEKWISSYVSNRLLCRNPPSIVAKIKGEVVGVCIMEDYNNQPAQPDNKEITEMANACDDIIRKSSYISYDCGYYGYISFIAVNKEYRRRNIAESMITYCNKIVRELGYKYSIAFCTSYRSKHLFEKQGYKCLGGIPYRELKSFIKMPDDECSVMILSL